MKVAGAIIAGGRSERMGADKSLMIVGSTTIMRRIVGCLRDQVEIVILNSNVVTSDRPAAGIPVVPDILGELKTPLTGIHAALVWGAAHGYEWVTTVPADTPFLPGDLTKRLLPMAEVTGAAIAASAGHRHYIIGTWSTKLAVELENSLLRDRLCRVRDWTERVNAVAIEWPVPDYDPFFNVNTPEDLAQAQRLAVEFPI